MASRLDDVQRALRWVRANAAKSAVDGLTRTFAKELVSLSFRHKAVNVDSEDCG